MKKPDMIKEIEKRDKEIEKDLIKHKLKPYPDIESIKKIDPKLVELKAILKGYNLAEMNFKEMIDKCKIHTAGVLILIEKEELKKQLEEE